MVISAFSPASIWSNATRSLTNIGSAAMGPNSTVATSLAGAASVDFASGAGFVSILTVAVLTGASAAASIAIQLWDGTTTIQLAATAAAAGSPAGFTGYCNNPTRMRILNNDATHAGTYIVTGQFWTI